MAETKGEQSDLRSAGLTLSLPSNNPFRNRAASPGLASPPIIPPGQTSPFDDPPARPVSRNPFLDDSNMASATPTEKKLSPAEELFDALTLDDKKPDDGASSAAQGPLPPPYSARPPNDAGPRPPPGARPPHMRRGPPGRENMPPPGRRGPPPGHRPSRSQEEALRARRAQGTGPDGGEPSSPAKRLERRPRRNSESSVADPDKPRTEEEKKAREARRKERERRHKDAKDRKPVNRRMDIIDRLDATSIYGTGLFHHDGPFDALNPHRNRTGSRRAPMQAFPKDSLNNVIGGSGPLNARPDHATFMGNADDEAFKDYASGAPKKDGELYPPPASKADVGVFDPLSRGSVLHGDETLGLGTSTFLEGTPAARTAIQRREQDIAQETFESGIQRKKSLAQRIRSINRGPREYPSGRMTNPENVYLRSPTDSAATSSSLQTRAGEPNPFFNEFDTKADETISVRRSDAASPTGVTSPTSPKRSMGLERRATADAVSPDEAQSKAGASGGGGLLARVKSLKGGRRAPPPRPDQGIVESPPATSPTTAPGTAV